MSNKIRSIAKEKQRRADAAETMTVSLAQLIQSQEGIGMISQTRLPGQQSLMFGRLIRDVSKELETYEPVRKALCEKHGVLSDDKSEYTFTDENREKFNTEHRETVEAEIILHHKKMPELLDLKDENNNSLVRLLPSEALSLEWLIGS